MTMKTLLNFLSLAFWFLIAFFAAAAITAALAQEPPPSKPAPTCECGVCE